MNNSISKISDIQYFINESYSDKEPLTESQKASRKCFNDYCKDIKKDLEVLEILKKQLSIEKREAESGITFYYLKITTKGLEWEKFNKNKEVLE